MSADDFEAYQRSREDTPMSRGQALTLLVASGVLLVAAAIAAPFVLHWSAEAARPHFGRQSIDTLATVSEVVEGGLLLCGFGGAWAGLKALVRGR